MGKTILQCTNCSKEFEKYESEYKRAISRGIKNFFCSRKCNFEYKSKQVTYHDFTCLSCGNVFQRTEREVKNAKRLGQEIKFCSKKCKSDYWGRNRKEVKCSTCDKLFLRQEKDICPDHNFCSAECYDIYLESLRVEINCIQCSKTFSVLKSDLANIDKMGKDRVQTCSDECYENYKMSFYETIACKNCEKEFTKLKSNKNRVFCSTDCREEYWERFHRVLTICDYCGNEITLTKSHYDSVDRHFCNDDCWNAYRAKEKEEYSAIAHYLRSTKEYEDWRINVFKRAYYTCEECGEKGKIIHAHHIKHLYDIAKMFNFDIDSILKSDIFNDVNNGQCLCTDCHMKKHPNIKRNSDGTFCRPDAEPY